MRNSTLSLIAIAGVSVALGMGGLCAAEEQKPTTGDPAKDAMMAQWQQASTPGEGHKRLEPLVGNWQHTAKWQMDPSAAPEESQGTNENRWILGGRFLQQDFKGQMMGQPFEGLGIIGYDNMAGEYKSVWLDNMSTSLMTSTVQYDAASGAFNESGTFSCPMTGEKNKWYRAVLKITDNDHYTYEMYSKDKDGKEFKNMEIAYRRQ